MEEQKLKKSVKTRRVRWRVWKLKEKEEFEEEVDLVD